MITEVIVLALPGHRAIDRIAFLEVLSEAQAISGAISLTSLCIEHERDTWKLHGAADARPGSVLVVCAASRPGDAPTRLDQQVAAVLRRAWRDDVLLCALGSAPAQLAAQGFLDNRRAACLPAEHRALRQSYPLVRWDAQATCTADRNLLTGIGFFGATECALRLLQVQGRAEVAQQVASRLGIRQAGANAMPTDAAVPRAHLHPAVQRAVEVLQRDPLRPWTTADVASAACVSERHLQRLFKGQLSCGILDFIQKLRLQRAMSLVHEEPHASLEKVAEAAGFTSTQQLRRIWRREHGQTPSEQRRQGTPPDAGGGGFGGLANLVARRLLADAF